MARDSPIPPAAVAASRQERRALSPFAGREAEFALIARALDEAREGRGAAILVSGEAGIGKSRLCEEAAAEARDAGFMCVTGRCDEIGAGPALDPFVEVLEALARAQPPGELEERLGAAADAIARVAPGVQDLRDGPAPTPETTSDGGRRVLFNGIAAFIERCAEVQPLLIFLEDLHWAGETALSLLQHIARRLEETPVVVLATYRDAGVAEAPALARTIEALSRGQLATEIALGPLTADGVRVMLGQFSPFAPHHRTVASIYQATGGNAFFVVEVTRHLHGEGRLVAPDGAWLLDQELGQDDVPRSVRLVIERRVGKLSSTCQGVLAVAAVAGREFDYQLLEEVCKDGGGGTAIDAAGLLLAIDEARLAHLLEESGPRDLPTGGAVAYAFVHELARQALLTGLSLARQQSLHQAVGAALERIHAANPRAHAAEIAAHYRRAGHFADPEKVIEHCLSAGQAAQAGFAHPEAVAHMQTALNLMIEHGAEPERIARVRVRMANLLSWLPEFVDGPQAMENLRAAEPVLVPLGDSRDLATLLAGMGSSLYYGGQCEKAMGYLRQAMEMAERLGAEATWAGASALYGMILVMHEGEIARGLELIERAADVTRRLGDERGYWAALGGSVVELAFLNDPTAARDRLLRELADPRERYRSYLTDFLAGVAAEAEVLTGNLHTEGGAMPLVAGNVASTWRGAWEQQESGVAAWRAWARAKGSRFNELTGAHWLARGRAVRGDHEQAAALFEEILDLAGHPCGGREMMERPRLARAYLALGRREDARAQVERCREIANRGEDWHGATGQLLLAEAALAAFDRRLEEAEEIFEQAVEVFRRYRLPWDEAEAFEAWGEALAAKGRRLRRAALEKIDAALDIYRAHGAGQPLIDRVRASRERIAGGEGAPRVYPNGLTAREAEVLRLIANGRSNREIAVELVLSVRTVGRHVTNIYTKIGAHNRSDATAYALKHSLN